MILRGEFRVAPSGDGCSCFLEELGVLGVCGQVHHEVGAELGVWQEGEEVLSTALHAITEVLGTDGEVEADIESQQGKSLLLGRDGDAFVTPIIEPTVDEGVGLGDDRSLLGELLHGQFLVIFIYPPTVALQAVGVDEALYGKARAFMQVCRAQIDVLECF